MNPPEPKTAAHRELPRQVLTHSRLLGERMYQHSVIRFLLAFTIIAGGLVGKHLVGVRNLDATALTVLGVVVLFYNAIAWIVTRSRRVEQDSQEAEQVLLRTMYGAIVVDYIILTVGIWIVGGTRSPFLAFYLLHVIISGILLSRRAAITFHALGYGMLAMLVIGEWSGLIPPNTPEGAVAGSGPLDGRYAITVLFVYGLLFLLTGFLLVTFANNLRNAERRIRRANAELTRLSNLRRDFLDIALHNLQSPIGVAMMHLRNLRDGLGGQINPQQMQWIDRSLDRLGGLTGFMRDLQTLSTLESMSIEKQAAEVDVAALLGQLVDDFTDAAQQHDHDLHLEIEGEIPRVRAVEVLLREAVANYISNAIKYSPDGGRITVRARYRAPTVRIEVEDDGIGLSAEDRGRLFSEFVRIRQKGKPVAKVQGTGLGLTIVKRIIEAHGGGIGVESEPGKGSTFWIELVGPTGPGAAADPVWNS